MIPRLRVRTEYSFRVAYGPTALVAARLSELGCPAAGIVDTEGTWGHVNASSALSAAGVEPMYGFEFKLTRSDGRKPSCWVLAEDLRMMYRFSSSLPSTEEEIAEAKGIIRFSGAALSLPEAIDFIDVDPASLRSMRRGLALAKTTGKPIVLAHVNDCPSPDHIDRMLAWTGGEKVTPQYIVDDAELETLALRCMTLAEFRQARINTFAAAERARGLKLAIAPMISVEVDLPALAAAGKAYRLDRGHIKEWTGDYEARLQRELELIESKGYASYFAVVADLICWAKERMLVGPGRGSSAGSLVCYLLRITELDPLVHRLFFERFIDTNRSDLPDIDIDFNDSKRHLAIDYLSERYGADRVARIGSINRIKGRSALAHVGKKLGIPARESMDAAASILEYSSGDSRYGKGLEDTLFNTAPGRKLIEKYPEYSLATELELHASHSGVHAAGVIVSAVPVCEYCTVRDGVAQLDKYDADALNLLKIDALGLRTLGVIEDAGVIEPQALYDLDLNDPRGFVQLNAHRFAGIFQFEGAAQRRVSKQFPSITRFDQLDHITALSRPGPLGGGATGEYLSRELGLSEVTYKHPILAKFLDDTLGVVIYQEQVMSIVKEVGGFSWEETSDIRKAMSGRKGIEYFDARKSKFVEGAAKKGISEEVAINVWNEICTFGAWGMNKAHTASYAVISYWCSWIKEVYPLEYAAACLRNARHEDKLKETLRELLEERVTILPFDPTLAGVDWTIQAGGLMPGFISLKGIGPSKAERFIRMRAQGTLTEQHIETLLKTPSEIPDFNEGRKRWKSLYDDPASANIAGKIKMISELRDRENAVIIAKVTSLNRKDKNESALVGRRGGKLLAGETRLLDIRCVDDSIDQPIIARVGCDLWRSIGSYLSDELHPGKDWILVRGIWLERFSMLSVKKIRMLTNYRKRDSAEANDE